MRNWEMRAYSAGRRMVGQAAAVETTPMA